MTPEPLPSLNLALTLLRMAANWNQAELARAAGVRPTVISDYERGHKKLTRPRLEELVGYLGFTGHSIDLTLRFVESVRRATRAPGTPAEPDEPDVGDRRRIDAIAAEAGRLASVFVFSVLDAVTIQGQASVARQQAPVLWRLLKRRTASERRMLVEEGQEFRSWALCELLCAESVKAAADSADRAVELAALALHIAELAPGQGNWGLRLQGYAWAHVGNARRVRGDLPGADGAFSRAGKLWEAGAVGDPGLLDEALVPGLEASLRINQCRLEEAAILLDRALTLDKGSFRTHLLLNRARLLERTGDYEGALATFEEAASRVSQQEEPRLLFSLRFNSAVNLCHLGRYAEAEAFLPEVRLLVARLGNGLDSVRLRWLEGRTAAGLGATEEALSALSWVRTEFAAQSIAYDAALVTLELAVLQLERGRTRDVKALARQMAPIFQTQGVHREALAALKLFCEAAEKEAATVELAKRIVEYLYRAQHNPQLRFEASE